MARLLPIRSASCSCATGFHFWAFLITPLWLLWHRLWLVLLIYLVVIFGIEQAMHYAGVAAAGRSLVMLLISFLVGLEASTLRRFTLARRGWRNVGVVSGTNMEAAERRFFNDWAAAGQGRSSGPGGNLPPRLPLSPAPHVPHAADRRSLSRTGRVAMSVAIVDYGSGNLHSAAKAFERAAHDAGIDQPIVVTSDPEVVAAADRVVLPGVGAFADCRRGLDAVDGMVAALEEAVRRKGRPFFGICVGMQLLAERGREYEVTQGLGWIAGEVDRIKPSDPHLKIPHMGWNTLNCHAAAQIARRPGAWFRTGCTPISCILTHSTPSQRADLVAEAEYGGAAHRDCRRATTLSARNFIPRKARSSGLR